MESQIAEKAVNVLIPQVEAVRLLAKNFTVESGKNKGLHLDTVQSILGITVANKSNPNILSAGIETLGDFVAQITYQPDKEAQIAAAARLSELAVSLDTPTAPETIKIKKTVINELLGAAHLSREPLIQAETIKGVVTVALSISNRDGDQAKNLLDNTLKELALYSGKYGESRPEIAKQAATAAAYIEAVRKVQAYSELNTSPEPKTEVIAENQ